MIFGHGLRPPSLIAHRMELALQRLRLALMANFCSHRDVLNTLHAHPAARSFPLGKSDLTMN
jgi:hypothetical protein